MDWYKYFFERLKTTSESYTGTDLYIALCRAIAISDISTRQDLRDLTRAFDEWYGIENTEEELSNESTRTISKSAV